MPYSTVNPYTGELLATFANATDEEISQAITQADQTFQEWKLSSFQTRREILQRAADLLRSNVDYYAKFLTLEMGKIFAEAKAEVELSAQIFEYYVKYAEKLLQDEPLQVADPATGNAVLVHEPLGVLLAVEPWNFPYYQIARIIAPQLSAGNTILLKHASNVPQCAQVFEKLMLEAGLPNGAFINLFLSHDKVETVLKDPRVHGVALTGSEGAGSAIAALAGKYMKKSTLELGGADAFIVLADADLDKTVNWAVFGRHWNAGQVCVSSKRMIIDASIYDEFLAKYIAQVELLKAGDPMDPATQLAPLSSQKAADDVRKQIDNAIAHGATAIEVGAPVPSQGAFVQPTILTDIDASNPAYYEEFFGPVSMLFKAENEADAVRIANDSNYGLGGSVFGRDVEQARKVAMQIQTGMVFVNHPTMVKADLPFGGIKRSGYGRELLGLGLKEFVNIKLVDVVDIDAAF
ncbi:NAD-dependent succinate-semialdehyde dehydrogenase [Acinetobacter gerneri]|uniref:NAD-dependent succinate-semialdehyde dehydrogenase n=1 Tax=Acinetobacter gerneri TaxID=202952 RepID=A0AAW8JGJ1_9GAMM|nr:NAD-dependent succinate-semialdehyde dehydrogenase [Acinetobacter gerneri]MDQ9009432.1 NAD-dependent succinate-semialdehyde dehydrogenase [Acinetobacter gerneri]MDQ9013537.1 NAD-dependent succinate-semialdehyde dehydrogenase [Acinetobacter gerneri]MDQ9024899.1 NAD-dependent succinate-semialdehyde dehydrogenase [Acinetobacter gerneri]MDQ9052422.1 NAD-dependent succinate-semialdehyde dehydrogenase [Acinetobacter gerneri]MDQ9059853.1 NAD-dependent succinate-semialdehyde dehydrogenase [Acinetob